jgi:hypothetical protein
VHKGDVVALIDPALFAEEALPKIETPDLIIDLEMRMVNVRGERFRSHTLVLRFWPYAFLIKSAGFAQVFLPNIGVCC